MDKLIELIQKIAAAKFYGETTIKWEAGKPVMVVKIKENIKLT